MDRYSHRLLLLGLLVVSSYAGLTFHRGAAESSSAPPFTADAATLIEQNGEIGTVYMPALPTYCVQVTVPYIGYVETVSLSSYPSNPIGITTSPGRSSQRVTLQTRVYQRLANGSYQDVGGYPIDVTGLVETGPQAVQPIGDFVNLPAGPDYLAGYAITWYATDGETVQGQAVAIKAEHLHYVDGRLVADERPLCDRQVPPSVSATAKPDRVAG